ncbi:MAG: aminoglycoside phosphotransferase family protein, partial [Chloroflexales bacterium]|nr:aminoglycoside phosphotransferase family protein [Chloroflexales bacterium]
MREKPPIADEQLIASVSDNYGIIASSIQFLPLGADSFAWVYRVEGSDGAAYFLKLRQGALNQASLLVPRFLRASGVANVA